jgi:predicted DCC family thiol-disulfide oxidoreductase YuxK
MPRALLIYDAACTYCRRFVRTVHRLDRAKVLKTLAFDSPEAQSLLQAQFGSGYGFAMFLFESQTVSWGAGAAGRVAQILELPSWMARLAFRLYPTLVQLVSKLTRRERAVCGPDCVSTRHSSHEWAHAAPLTEAAHDRLRRLLAESGSPGSIENSLS